MAFMTAAPIGDCEMAPATYSLALRRALGVHTDLGPPGAVCPYCPGAEASALHATVCTRGGLQNPAHHKVARGLLGALRYAGVGPVRREDSSALDGPRADGRDLRMDLVAASGAVWGASNLAIRAKQLLIDITLRHPCGLTALRTLHTALIAGAAAARGETDKQITYAGTYSPATAILICFAIETHGRLGAQAESLLEEVAVHKL